VKGMLANQKHCELGESFTLKNALFGPTEETHVFVLMQQNNVLEAGVSRILLPDEN
jgi:hypothetical protein